MLLAAVHWACSEVAGCQILGVPEISASTLVGRVRILKTRAVARLLPTHWSEILRLVLVYWQAELVPRILLRTQGSQNLFQITVVGSSSRHSWVCGLGCPKGCIILWGLEPSWSQGSVWPVLWDHSFLASAICLLLGKVCLEACLDFLVGRTFACLQVGEARSGLGYVWVSPSPETAVGSLGRLAADGLAVSLPNVFFGLKCPSTVTCRLWVMPGLELMS